jgi:hypothetical protein
MIVFPEEQSYSKNPACLWSRLKTKKPAGMSGLCQGTGISLKDRCAAG